MARSAWDAGAGQPTALVHTGVTCILLCGFLEAVVNMLLCGAVLRSWPVVAIHLFIHSSLIHFLHVGLPRALCRGPLERGRSRIQVQCSWGWQWRRKTSKATGDTRDQGTGLPAACQRQLILMRKPNMAAGEPL